jgi:hypothetical protein
VVYDISGGGDFGVSNSPDGATCGGATAMGFDHHSTAYRMLNCDCVKHYLYSYSAVVFDGDAGYDANIGLGSWPAKQLCQSAEDGTLGLYAAMR